jgi:hypothetical protein
MVASGAKEHGYGQDGDGKQKTFSRIHSKNDVGLSGGMPGSTFPAPSNRQKSCRIGSKASACGGSNPLGCLVFAGIGADEGGRELAVARKISLENAIFRQRPWP